MPTSADARKARAELGRLLDSVNRSAPSVTKYDEFTAWLAEKIGMRPDQLYTATISKPGNLVVRFKQSGRRPTLGLAVVETAGDLDGSIAAGKKLVGPNSLMPAMAFCVRPRDQSWDLLAVVEAGDHSIAKQLSNWFPRLQVYPPENAESLPMPTAAEPEEPSPEPADDSDLMTPDSRARLADGLGVERGWIDDLHWMLKDKRALVLYGPPGTGKTYVARALAEALQPDTAKRNLVQLHPSYAYEDFFEGYRPRPSDHGFTLTKSPGPLRRLAEAANATPDEPVVLVLDEMNRGNLPKIFGELYFLLEYRGDAVGLMYSPDESFRLPENLYVIGTMNTADRSIVSVDQALRRRFHFSGMFPGEHPVAGMLRRYLERHVPALRWVADVLDLANARLGDRNVAIGPSHFMRPDLDADIVRRVWSHSILPTLEDHFFGNALRLEEFKLDVLQAAVAGAAGQNAGGT